MIGANRNKRLSLLVLTLLTGATLCLSFVIAWPFLTPIVTATLLAIAFHPLFIRISRYIRNRSGAALLSTLIVLIAILLPTVLTVNKLARETTALYGWLNEQQSLEGGWREYAGSVVDPALEWLAATTG